MKPLKYQALVKYMLEHKETNPFWQLMDLAKGDFKHYSGPRTRDDYKKILQSKYCGKTYKEYSKIVLQFYRSYGNAETQKSLTWAFIVSPFVLGPCRETYALSGTKFEPYDCYDYILNSMVNCNANEWTDTKLQYDLLTLIIDRLTSQYKIGKYYGSMPGLNDRIQKMYERACYLRANCKYSNTDDTKIRNTKIQDKRVYLRNATNAQDKRDCAIEIFKILIADASYQLGNTHRYRIEGCVREICQMARDIAGEVGYENMDLVERVWKYFDTAAIMNIIRDEWEYFDTVAIMNTVREKQQQR